MRNKINEAKKICTINDITSIDFNLANVHQIENYDMNFQHGNEKILLISFSLSSKSAKMVIQCRNS